MNAAHVHLVLTHFPIIGTIFGVLILIYALITNNTSVKKVAYGIFVFTAIVSIPVFLSGENAEEIVEDLPGVSERLIENHEELAEKVIWLAGLLGLLSLVNLYAMAKKLSFVKTLSWIILVLSLITAGFFAKTGNLGGQIRHSEIRKDNAGQEKGIYKSEQGKEEGEEEDDDDD